MRIFVFYRGSSSNYRAVHLEREIGQHWGLDEFRVAQVEERFETSIRVHNNYIQHKSSTMMGYEKKALE